jgi:tripartite-type tricarboxylate transporter receptor subunit TctC
MFARNLTRHIGKYLPGSSFVVENRPGASGSVAAHSVSRAKPDGYTLLLGRLATNVIQPAGDARTPYRWNDFTALGILEFDPLICVVDPASPHKDPRELMAAVRARPGSLKYGTAGPGTLNNFAVQYWLSLSGLKPEAAEAVHFNGSPEMLKALQERQIQFFCGVAAAVMPQIKSGAVHPLFTTASGRLPELPQIRTASEVGLRDMGRMITWSAVMGPPGLPPQVVVKWKEALAGLAQDPEWIKETERMGGQPAILAIKEPAKFIQDQHLLYERLLSTLALRK